MAMGHAPTKNLKRGRNEKVFNIFAMQNVFCIPSFRKFDTRTEEQQSDEIGYFSVSDATDIPVGTINTPVPSGRGY